MPILYSYTDLSVLGTEIDIRNRCLNSTRLCNKTQNKFSVQTV